MDREFGFLKEMLVAPIRRTSIAIGKAIGGFKKHNTRYNNIGIFTINWNKHNDSKVLIVPLMFL